MTDYPDPAWTDEGRFRGALDDVIIIPLVCVALVANKILRFILSILMRLLDYAFPIRSADCLASALCGQAPW
jgi:hypothetical protein